MEIGQKNFRLIVDSREQLPLTFRATENYDVVTEKLDFGDYGMEIDGKLVHVFERKGVGDMFSTLTAGHDRFKKEIARAKEAGIAFNIVVEESYGNIINKKFANAFRTKTPGYVLAKIIHTMQLRHGVTFLFFNDRTEMRDYIRNTFNAIITEYQKKQKRQKKVVATT